MKKLFLTFIYISIVFGIFSCHKEDNDESKKTELTNEQHIDYNLTWPSNSEEIDTYMAIYYKEHKYDRGVFQSIWKWIKVRIGTHLFDNCIGSNPCGPCPGICLKLRNDSSDIFNLVDDDYCITRGEYDDGERLMQAALLNDTTMALTFVHSDFIINDILYIPEDFNVGSSLANSYRKQTITVLEGEYPVSYTHSKNGTTLVRVNIR